MNEILILLDITFLCPWLLYAEYLKLTCSIIILVTSKDSDVDELISMNLGADDFITKPYNTEILLARVTNILRRTSGDLRRIIS